MSMKDQSSDQTLEINKSIIIRKPATQGFKALTESKKLVKWFQDQTIVKTKVGGRVKFVTLKQKHPEYNLDKDYVMEGTIIDFVPNKKLAYSWKFNDIPTFPETQVIWELEEIDSDHTRVKLTHSGFTGNETGLTSLQSHDEGWTEAMNKLAKYCDENR